MNIIYDSSRLKIGHGLFSLCEYAGLDENFANSLWQDMALEADVYNEFVYYLINHTFLDKLSIKGYSLSDLYVFQMDKYNLLSEIGKNPVDCNKERMVLKAFRMLVDMKRDPDTFIKRLESGRGEDRL